MVDMPFVPPRFEFWRLMERIVANTAAIFIWVARAPRAPAQRGALAAQVQIQIPWHCPTGDLGLDRLQPAAGAVLLQRVRPLRQVRPVPVRLVQGAQAAGSCDPQRF